MADYRQKLLQWVKRDFPVHRIDRSKTFPVTFDFEGEIITAQKGDSVAAALLANGHKIFRTTPISGATRGPLCMMGICFECLVEIDGKGNQQACMREVQEGMRIRIQRGAVKIEPDLSPVDEAES